MTVLSINWMNAWRCVYFFAVYVLANDTQTNCSCTCACVEVWTLWLYPKIPATSGHCSYVHDTTITRHRQHDVHDTIWIKRSRCLTKIYYEDFCRVSKVNWFYVFFIFFLFFLFFMLLATKHFVQFTNQKCTPKDQTDLVTPFRGHKFKSKSREAFRAAQ